MKRDVSLFVEDILEAISDIHKSVNNISMDEFLENKDIRDANIRRLEIIGEAVKNIPNSIKEKHPSIQWNKIAGLRDILSHAYFGVNLSRIWEVIKKDLPKLERQIEKIKKR